MSNINYTPQMVDFILVNRNMTMEMLEVYFNNEFNTEISANALRMKLHRVITKNGSKTLVNESNAVLEKLITNKSSVAKINKGKRKLNTLDKMKSMLNSPFLLNGAKRMFYKYEIEESQITLYFSGIEPIKTDIFNLKNELETIEQNSM